MKGLSFFSGALGLDVGLEQEGVHLLLASEIESVIRKTIAANRPRVPVIGDIEQYTAGEISRIARLGKDEEIDLVVSIFPI